MFFIQKFDSDNMSDYDERKQKGIIHMMLWCLVGFILGISMLI